MVEPRSDFESGSANTVSLENSGTKKNESHVTSAVNAPIFMPNRVRTGRATCCLVDNEENGVLEWPKEEPMANGVWPMAETKRPVGVPTASAISYTL